MKVVELLEKFRDLELTGQEDVLVHASGGMRRGKAIGDVSVGFDWDMGAIILHPKVPLQIMDKVIPKLPEPPENVLLRENSDKAIPKSRYGRRR